MKIWYMVHVIRVTEVEFQRSMDPVDVEECPLFICASSPKEARIKALEIANENFVLDFTDGLMMGNQRCRVRIGGVRKVVEVENTAEGEWVADGVELTYWRYRIRNQKELERWLGGESVDVTDFE